MRGSNCWRDEPEDDPFFGGRRSQRRHRRRLFAQEPAMDFLSANEAKLEGVPDPTVLAMAAEQERILVSHDFQTMPRHFGDFLQTHAFSPGVLLVPQYLPIGAAIEEIVLIWGASDPGEWENRILRIPLP